eukprot:CAMPEP_0118701538 /NCGR_PEP_ID=MMETSP0800-20121206/17313_1 /TAXON_ID=210618 ORGANISM="Striatella unipunctata, Strain CCMP2910" /NCGR_SAMPLE_ID=MMETSP0800 /ASSEMBLY_ACC=CAM_ASM_000638 /LENGTH=270 /DNA_ID=CAMNT_0006602483 /DNA_START=54 /DNA_END=866 /DNA_ORIENTATION=+
MNNNNTLTNLNQSTADLIGSLSSSSSLIASDIVTSLSTDTTNMNTSTTTVPQKKIGKSKKKCWKKPKDKPKRPLSAYNLFFQEQRERILSNEGQEPIPSKDCQARRNHKKSHGKIGFAALARTVASKWKILEAPDRVKYEQQASVEKNRYKMELEKWNEKRRLKSLLEFSNATQKMHMPQPTLPISDNLMMDSNDVTARTLDLFTRNTFGIDSSSMFHPNGHFHALQGGLLPQLGGMHKSLSQNDDIYTSSLNELVSNLDDECLDFLSQI